MTALAATDFTVTVEDRRIVGKKRRTRVKLVFGDSALTYPSGGIPAPTAAQLGMLRNLDFLNILDQDDSQGLFWKYDLANNKLRCYVQGYDHGAGGAVTLDDYPITAAVGVTSGISISLTTGAGAAVGRLGGLVELDTAAAPAATTMYAEAVGW